MAGTVGGVLLLGLLLFDPVYRAEAQILIEPGPEHLFDPALSTSGVMRPVMSFVQEEQLSLATEILTGRSVAEEVAEKVGPVLIYPDAESDDPEVSSLDIAARRLRREIEVEPVGRSLLVAISFEHPDAATSSRVVNALVDAYLKRHTEIHQDVHLQSFFADQLSALEQKLATGREALTQFKQKHRISSSVSAEREELERRLLALKQAEATAEISQAEVRTRVGRLRYETAGRDRSRPASRILLLEALEKVQAELVAQEVELRALGERRRVQAEQIALVEQQLAEIGQIELPFMRLAEDQRIWEQQHALYVKKLRENEASEAMDQRGLASVRVVERAAAPKRPEKSPLGLALATCLVLGLVGGLGWIHTLELLSSTLDTADDVTRYLDVPVIAVIPEAKTQMEIEARG